MPSNNHCSEHFSSFLAIFPLFCSSVLSRCSSSSSALWRPGVKGQTHTEAGKPSGPGPAGLPSAEWNPTGPVEGSMEDLSFWRAEGGGGVGSGSGCEGFRGGCTTTTTYSFSWASRSRTSASRLLTSMTSSSSSSCSRLFWASVFCQSATTHTAASGLADLTTTVDQSGGTWTWSWSWL